MRKIFSKMDKPLLFITIAFFLFGLLMILSASSMESLMYYEKNPYYYFYRQAIFLTLGIIIFLIIIRIPTKVYQKFYYLFMFIIIICLGALFIIGHSAKGTQGWFDLGGLSIQPSEFAKIVVIIFLACYYEKNKLTLDNHKSLLKPLIYIFIIILLVALQPDIGTASIIALISFFMFFSLPMSKKYRFKYTSIVIVGIILVALIFIITKGSFLESYQLNRFNFLNPCDRYQEDSGYQLCNSFIAFSNGGLTGQGIGKSTQKYLYLPESYTDFIFPIIVEEWGVFMGIVIILLYLFIIYRLYSIARHANTLENSLLAYGVCIYIFSHVVINLIGVMGIGPLTGVPLPFLSYGGSYAISLIISLALAQRVCIEEKNDKLKKKKKQK